MPIRRIGVLLAAGRGSRLGGAKQLSMWPTPNGGTPLVAAAYDAIRPICDEIVVVLGHKAAEVAAALRDRAFYQIISDPDVPMFESIRAGLTAALTIDPSATIVLQPGDHPEVSPATLERLSEASTQHPQRAIVPQVGDRGGHPAFIPCHIASRLIHAECSKGLGDFWKKQPQLCMRLPVDDPTALRDVDTLADLA